MTQPIGNVRLKAARQHAGYASQQWPTLSPAPRRSSAWGTWRSATIRSGAGNQPLPPGREPTISGSWSTCSSSRSKNSASLRPGTCPWPVPAPQPPPRHRCPGTPAGPRSHWPRPGASSSHRPSPVTMRPSRFLRRMYTSVLPTHLHPPVIEHPLRRPPARRNRRGKPHHRRHRPGRGPALAGRIEFFDLRQPDDADATFVRALQAAGEADDALLGSAILAHAAFVPGWAGRRDEYADRMRAARTYARRAPASAEFLAWLDAVEAECETISGHPREALRLIEHAESVLAAGNEYASRTGHLVLPRPPGRVQRQHPAQGRAPPPSSRDPDRRAQQRDHRRRQAAHRHPRRPSRRRSRPAPPRGRLRLRRTGPPAARHHLVRHRHAPDPEVRKTLQPWAEQDCIQALDDQLYGWQATLSTLQR